MKPVPDVTTRLAQAVTFHQQGRLAEAEALYRKILRQTPRHFDALHLLGVTEYQQGRPAEACRLIGAALRVNPESADAFSNQGNALQALGRLADALASYDRALAIRPDHVDALINRGNGLRALKRYDDALASYSDALAIRPDYAKAFNYQGVCLKGLNRHAEALASYDRALALKPDDADVHSNRGNALQQLKRYEEALASYDRALAIKPDHAEALGNRGVTLQQLKRYEEALASYDRALTIKPDYVVAVVNRGNVLQQLKRYEDALEGYDQALGIKPDYADAFSNRGACLQRLKRHEEALASYDRALAITPDHAEALSNRGVTLQQLKRYEEAVASYDRALVIKPDYAEAFNNRGNALHELKRFADAVASYDRALAIKPDYADAHYSRGNALRDLGRHDEAAEEYASLLRIAPDYPFARGSMFHSRVQCCDWRDFERNAELIVCDVQAGKLCVTPFVFLAVSGSIRAQLRCAQTYAEARYPASSPAVFKGGGYGHGKIRVAYLSTDLREHAVSFLMAGMLERHDRSRFETMAVSFGPEDASEVGKRVRNAFDRFIDVRGKSDLEVAHLMRELEIDIAIDLMGFTGDNRTAIFAHRAAPVQVSYLGFPGTLGAPYIDYLLADNYVIPAGDQSGYAEQVVYLPDTFQANDAKREIAERTPTRTEAGLPESGFVFCCFNNSYKITPRLFGVWMRLLVQVEGSVLWLVKDRASVESNLRREAAAHGVDPGRLVFAPRLKYPEHLARYRLAGLFLDTLPFNAGTTASDALWVGLPVLTCSGEAYAARMAGSLLHAVGLPGLVTVTLDDYEALAQRLATDANLLAGIRAKLAQNRYTHPLFNTQRFTRHIESAYITMWERHQQGQPPAGFAVEAIDEIMPVVPGAVMTFSSPGPASPGA